MSRCCSQYLAADSSPSTYRAVEKRIGLFRGRRDHRGGQNLLGRPATAWIENVPVSLSLIMKELRS